MRFLAALLFFIGMVIQADADLPYSKGEQVEVWYYSRWLPGTVQSVVAGGLACEYEYYGRKKTGQFSPNQLRRLCEKDALSRARIFKANEGDFSVAAAVLQLEESIVHLRTTKDKTIEVPIEKLSVSDRAFLKRLKKNIGGVMPSSHRKKILKFDDTSAIEVAAVSDSGSQSTALEPDPMRRSLELAEGGAAFSVGNSSDQIEAIIPLGGKDQWLLASMVGEDLPTRLMWVSIKKSSSKMQKLPKGLQLKDYYAPMKLALTYDANDSVLSLWKTDPSVDVATNAISWYSDDIPSSEVNSSDVKNEETSKSTRVTSTRRTRSTSDDSWARFASDRIVISRDDKRNLTGWDFRDRKAVWRTVQESSRAPAPELTPGNRYLLIPELNRLRITNPSTGQTVATIPVEGEILSLAVADDGRNALMLLDSQLVGVDLTDVSNPRPVDVGFMNLPSTTTVRYLNEDVVCISTSDREMLLFSLERGIPLWRYEFNSSATTRNAHDDRVRRVIDNHLVYAAGAYGKSKRVSKIPGIGIGAVELPGGEAQGFVKYLKRDELIVFGEGKTIKLEIDAIELEDEIRQAMEQRIQKNGWTLDDNSPHSLVATLVQGPAQQVEYRPAFGRSRPPIPRFGPQFGPQLGPQFGPQFGPRANRSTASSSNASPPPSGPIQRATIRPYLSSIVLKINDQPAWVAGSRSGSVPPFLSLSPGETLQGRLDDYQKPSARFFKAAKVPKTIINPEFRTGLGTSLVTNQGLKEKKK